nr:GGDEF domain-containing protein [uncultured Cohaesibacter sp.]
MDAGEIVPEGDLYPIYDDLSDGILIIDLNGRELYRNKAMRRFPEHLEKRLRGFLFSKEDPAVKTPHEDLAALAKMEGWSYNCYAYGANKLVLVRFDSMLGQRIKAMRREFSEEIRDGMLPAFAAMKVLREHVNSRWIAIGNVNRALHQVTFDLVYDGAHLEPNGFPPLMCSCKNTCEQNAVLTTKPEDFFLNGDELKAMGVGHVIGMSMYNHHNECVGYALLADEDTPQHVNQKVTLLNELSVLYGPYFEVKSAHQKVSEAVADANTDALTGHGNRRALEHLLHECLSVMEQEQNSSDVVSMFDPNAMRNTVIMLIDLDGFKRVNDLMGHVEGDKALQLVADGLYEIDHNSRVFRFGGDELAQVFPRAGNLEAEELRHSVNEVEQKLAEAGFRGLGLSIGIVHLFEGDGSYASLMTLADARMYHEKRLRSVSFV